MTVGYSMTMRSWEEIMKPINQGTKRSPAHWNMYKKAAKKGAPRAKAMSQLFTRSPTKRAGVVLLNPCFSSSTKVEYTDNGRVGKDESRYIVNENMIDCRI